LSGIAAGFTIATVAFVWLATASACAATASVVLAAAVFGPAHRGPARAFVLGLVLGAVVSLLS
jgi:hypothetical protein